MSGLYQSRKTETTIGIEDFGGGFVLKSDRMFAYFPNRKDLDEWAQRCKKFIAALHDPSHPNNAGFYLALDASFGTDEASDCHLAVYPAAMGEDGGDQPVVIATNISNDDAADCLALMTRKWVMTDEVDASSVDGGFEAFRSFFMAHSEEA